MNTLQQANLLELFWPVYRKVLPSQGRRENPNGNRDPVLAEGHKSFNTGSRKSSTIHTIAALDQIHNSVTRCVRALQNADRQSSAREKAVALLGRSTDTSTSCSSTLFRSEMDFDIAKDDLFITAEKAYNDLLTMSVATGQQQKPLKSDAISDEEQALVLSNMSLFDQNTPLVSYAYYE